MYDHTSIVTPEGVTLDLPLAGVGSRFIAAVIDTTIQVLLVLGIGLIAAAAPDSGLVAALTVVAAFSVFIGYDISFETLASGRTPGKRVTGLRVVTSGGAPVRFITSAIRNVLRLIDILPGSYFVGIVAIVATKRNQRLGDLAAGTLVVRERTAAAKAASDWTSAAHPPVADTDVEGWDATGLTGDEVATVRRFLERRTTLVPQARAKLAAELAGRLRPKVATPDDDLADETFLERALAAKRVRE
ncbi:MAG: hypothetical protein QOG87_3283 [Actinomycetota bacterium]|jgi:uncharacterized RDD family membrane protein YckC